MPTSTHIRPGAFATLILATAMGWAPRPLAQAVVVGTTAPVTTDPAVQLDSSISGPLIVWTDQRNGNDDIYFRNGSGPEVQLTTATTNDRLHDVSGSIIAYTVLTPPLARVRAYDAATGTDLGAISPDDEAAFDARIDGSLVVYEVGSSTAPDIAVTDLGTGEVRRLTLTPDLEENPVVSGSRVVYERRADSESPRSIVMHDLATGAETIIRPAASDGRFPDADGDWIVFDIMSGESDRDVALHNVFTGQSMVLDLPGDQQGAHVSGDVVTFSDNASGNFDVKLYHIPTGTMHTVAATSGVDFLSDISGNRITYSSNGSGNFDIFLYEFAIQLPEIAVAPLTHDFGDLTVGASETTVVTISNVGSQPLSIVEIGLASGGSIAFDIVSAPTTPLPIAPGATVDVTVRFMPAVAALATGVLEIRSNDVDEAVVGVELTGLGVAAPPTPSEELADLLAFFDAAVASGALTGNGSGNSAPGRLNALRNQIAAAGDLLEHGLLSEACGQLLQAFRRVDGAPQPPDFATGPAAAELAQRIQALRATLGC